ncbi:MAG: LCP family protein [Clostridia bacterium]|nr:LCP family protein [Clostridia bacterium]
MQSIDYDFDNLIDNDITENVQSEAEKQSNVYSVSELSGNSNILFAVKDETSKITLSFLVITDFDEKKMQIEFIDDESAMTRMFVTDGEKGLKNLVAGRYNITVDRYAIFDEKEFKTFLSKFDGITINISERIDYKSYDFNLLLEQGQQSVSGDIAYKLLKVCNKDSMELVLCDIVNSVLSPKFVGKAESLFKTFVNSSTTDISIVDYTDKIDKLVIYVNANDKFKPTPYIAGE